MNIDKERFEKIKKAVQEAPLSLREKKVLEFRFGLDDHITRTLEETGRMFGVTRERIRQIEAKAIEKLVKGGYLTIG